MEKPLAGVPRPCCPSPTVALGCTALPGRRELGNRARLPGWLPLSHGGFLSDSLQGAWPPFPRTALLSTFQEARHYVLTLSELQLQ